MRSAGDRRDPVLRAPISEPMLHWSPRQGRGCSLAQASRPVLSRRSQQQRHNRSSSQPGYVYRSNGVMAANRVVGHPLSVLQGAYQTTLV